MKDELTVDQTAKALKLDASTVLRWIRDGKVPFTFKDKRKVVKGTAVEKIKDLMERHGSNWHRFVTWTPYDRFESKTVTLDKIVPEVNSAQPTPPKFKQLAAMAKTLNEMGESNLAAHVSLRAVEVM